MVPLKIEPAGPREMLIAWSDTERAIVPYHALRLHCPCAGCVNEITGERMIGPKDIALDVRPLGVELVGRYAIKIQWSDQHSTGMYTFDRLREICRLL